MLPEDIKKGLEICFTTGDCYNCPYEEECDAEREENGISRAGALMYDALNLIKELEGTHCPRYCEEGDYVCVTLGNALKEIAELEAQSPKWISVEERLPSGFDVFNEGEDRFCEPAEYIVRVAGAELATAAMFDGVNFIPADYDGFIDGRMFADRVTHWMPLPKPPKEG